MKKYLKMYFEILILITGLVFWLGLAVTCNGQVLYESKKWDADVIVCITENKWSADRIVYYTKNKSEANTYGIAYWSSNKWEADYNIHFTKYKWQADELWYITKYKWQTNDEDKTWIGSSGVKFNE
tara:strand:+ start:1002 stop:1379 length:378 start_codon:yes stop_codon:yes gene_type:complete